MEKELEKEMAILNARLGIIENAFSQLVQFHQNKLAAFQSSDWQFYESLNSGVQNELQNLEYQINQLTQKQALSLNKN
jgi:hypothetical protein